MTRFQPVERRFEAFQRKPQSAVWLMAGAAVGLLATVLMPVPRPPEQPVIRAPADSEAV